MWAMTLMTLVMGTLMEDAPLLVQHHQTRGSAPSNKRPPGRKAVKEKLKKGGDSTCKESLYTMMATRKEIAAERK
jgi:hypothetical protein